MTNLEIRNLMVSDLTLPEIKKIINNKELYETFKHIKKEHNNLKKLKGNTRKIQKLLAETEELYNELKKNSIDANYDIRNFFEDERIELYPTVFVSVDDDKKYGLYHVSIVSFSDITHSRLEAILARFESLYPKQFEKYISSMEPIGRLERKYGKEAAPYIEPRVTILKHKYDLLSVDGLSDGKSNAEAGRGYEETIVVDLEYIIEDEEWYYKDYLVIDTNSEKFKVLEEKVEIDKIDNTIKTLKYIDYSLLMANTDHKYSLSYGFAKIAQDQNIETLSEKYGMNKGHTLDELKSLRKKALKENHPDITSKTDRDFMLVKVEVDFVFDALTNNQEHTNNLIMQKLFEKYQ
jgi:hypothetical protein